MLGQRMGPFRVLIIDDSKQVLEHARTVVGKTSRFGDNTAVHVETRCVHAQLDDKPGQDGRPTLSLCCLKELAANVEDPPDLILLDYGFSKPDTDALMKAVSRTGSCTADNREKITKGVMTAADVKRQVEQTAGLVSGQIRNLERHLFNSGAPVYLYTFRGPPALRDVIGDVDHRHRPIEAAFPMSDVITVDVHNELYAGDRFDKKRDPDHHPYLVARMLDRIVREESLKFQQNRTHRSNQRRGRVATVLVMSSGLAAGFGADLLSDPLRNVFKISGTGAGLLSLVGAAVLLGILLFVGQALAGKMQSGTGPEARAASGEDNMSRR
jgi:hypothetical protein